MPVHQDCIVARNRFGWFKLLQNLIEGDPGSECGIPRIKQRLARRMNPHAVNPKAHLLDVKYIALRHY